MYVLDQEMLCSLFILKYVMLARTSRSDTIIKLIPDCYLVFFPAKLKDNCSRLRKDRMVTQLNYIENKQLDTILSLISPSLNLKQEELSNESSTKPPNI
jgi:hypothetical protein